MICRGGEDEHVQNRIELAISQEDSWKCVLGAPGTGVHLRAYTSAAVLPGIDSLYTTAIPAYMLFLANNQLCQL